MNSPRTMRLALGLGLAGFSLFGCGSNSGSDASVATGGASFGTGGSSSGGSPATANGGTSGGQNSPGGATNLGGSTGGAPSASGGVSGLPTGGSSGVNPSSGGAPASTGGAPASTPDGGSGATGPSGPPNGTPTVFFLDALFGRVLTAPADGSPSKVISSQGSSTPDGVVVDVPNGFVYWTNMGAPDANDGFILRTKLDGSAQTTIVPAGGTFTPKQLKLDAAHGVLYWSDREGMKIQRVNVDGSKLETLVTIADGDTARADATNWAVGIALDVPHGKMYWTQKGPTDGGVGTIRRADIEIPAGEDAAHRTDIEILFSGLAEPIDMDVDLGKRQMYWTDRGDNTVSRAPMDPPAGFNPASRTDRTILEHGAGQAIGISLDLPRNTMYYTSLDTGTVWKAALDGSGATGMLKNQGSLTGIALVNLPANTP